MPPLILLRYSEGGTSHLLLEGTVKGCHAAEPGEKNSVGDREFLLCEQSDRLLDPLGGQVGGKGSVHVFLEDP